MLRIKRKIGHLLTLKWLHIIGGHNKAHGKFDLQSVQAI